MQRFSIERFSNAYKSVAWGLGQIVIIRDVKRHLLLGLPAQIQPSAEGIAPGVPCFDYIINCRYILSNDLSQILFVSVDYMHRIRAGISHACVFLKDHIIDWQQSCCEG